MTGAARPARASLLVAVAAAAAACAAGCAGPDRAASDPPAAAPAAAPPAPAPAAACTAPLPDLSRVSASVQAQIHARRAALTDVAAPSAAAAPAALAEAHGALGMILMASWFTAAAEPCLRAAAALAPDDFRWPYYLGHLRRDQGDPAGAAAFFEQARRLRPDDFPLQIALGELHLEQGRAAAARPFFEAALALQPDSLSARYGLGRAALQAEEYRLAADHLEAIRARNPEIGAVHYPLAMAYRGLGDEARAEAHLRQRENAEIRPADPLMEALDALLDSAPAYDTQGVEALDQEDWPAAAAQFRRGLEIDPDNPALRHRLGTALYMMGDAAGARRAFERVVRDDPDHPAAHYSLGVLAQEAGRHREAVERFSAAVAAGPDDAAVRLRLAISLRQAGDPEAALAHYAAVLQTSPDVVEARFGYAIALVQLDRYREARDRLATAMDAFPAEPAFPHALARLLAAAPDPAVRDGRQALALVERLMDRERTIDLGETMAMTLAELGRYPDAAAVQRELIAAAEAGGAPDVVRRLRTNLRLYERGEPCRTPWPPDALP